MYPENAVADSPVTIPRPVFEQIDDVVALIKNMRHNEELREGRLAAEFFDPLGEVCVCSDRVMQVMGWDHATLDGRSRLVTEGHKLVHILPGILRLDAGSPGVKVKDAGHNAL